MRGIVCILGLSVVLVGCDKAVEDKKISELTSEEAQTLCKSPQAIEQLTNNFKAGTSEFLTQHPFNYYPFSDRNVDSTKSITDSELRRKSRIDDSFLYSADTFNKGFGQTDVLKISNPTLSATGQDSLTCSAQADFSSDEIYGKAFSTPVSYTITKADKKIITEGKFALADMKQSKVEPTAGQKAWRDKYEAELNAKDQELKNVADSEYQPISTKDLFYIYFAQTPRQFYDDELMGLFSNKWNNTSDSFAKEDIKKEELPQIKAKIAQYKDIKNIVIYSTTDGSYHDEDFLKMKTASGENAIKINDMGIFTLTDSSYDFAKKGYEYHNFLCNMNGGITVNERGVSLSVDKTVRGCTVLVPDDQAREISAKFADFKGKGKNVSTSAKYFIHIDSINGDRNTIEATLVKDDVQLIDPDTKAVILHTVIN
ncbi:MAG: hypothetical protein KH310_11825 [Enterobacteriaceae bacterium]|nr:hypothetical protein [Enterobacteriaceae bacterium]